MPELPEVLTIAQTLNQNIVGFKFDRALVIDKFNVKPSKKVFLETLENNAIIKISNYAKNIVFELADNNFLVVHLAMTGQLILKKIGHEPSKWERVLFTLSKNGKAVNLAYNDMRMFGKLEVKSKQEYENYKQKYGLNPLDKKVTEIKFHEKIKTKKSTIKNVLLDQKVISGAGNIYVNDALFMAGISPKKLTAQLTMAESKRLLKKLREILNEGILHKGSTLNDGMFVDPFGKKGTHQNYFRIYGKGVCPNCRNRITFEKLNGRGTYYCETCQT